MSEQNKQNEEAEKLQRLKEEKERLYGKYKERGFQRISLKEYEELKARKAKRFNLSLPAHIKFILSTPFIIIFCFGLFFIPFMLYVIATTPSSPSAQNEKPKTPYDKVFVSQ